MTIDKENDYVIYEDSTHTYLTKDSGDKMVSVTSLIHSYVQPFNEEFWSNTKALEELVGVDKFKETKSKLMQSEKFDMKLLSKFNIDTVDFITKREEILQNWKTKNVEACERGSKIHKIKELEILGGDSKELKKYNLGGKFQCITDNRLKIGEKGIYPEILLHYISKDGVLKLAGQADILIIDGNNLFCLDFKTNRKIDKTSYYSSAKKKRQMMQYPLNDIQDSNYWHYCIQLSTYCWMAQQINPDLEVKGLALIHIDHDGKETVYELEYMKDAVERMISHYTRTLKSEKEYDKHRPIIY